MDKNTFIQQLSKKFVFMEGTAGVIYTALQAKKNVLLYGPGGHAKSEIVEYGLDLLLKSVGKSFDTDVFLTSCGKDMDSTAFMGYEDIVAYQNGQGLHRVLTETVYVKHQYAVLDEILDLPDYIMVSMKEPLQRRKLCVSNGLCINNTLETLFGCTNVDPYTWAGKDQSKLALLQRFHFIIKVEWAKYDASAFSVMLKTRYASSPELMHVANLAECCHKNNLPVSPRTVMFMMEMYLQGGIGNLEHIHGMLPEVYKKLLALEKSIPYVKEIEKIVSLFDTIPTESDCMKVIQLCAQVEGKIKSLKNFPTEGPYMETCSNMMKEVARYRQLAGQQLDAAAETSQKPVLEKW